MDVLDEHIGVGNSKARYDHFFVLRDHRRPEGGGNLGQLPSPEFENDDVICSFRAKYPKIVV